MRGYCEGLVESWGWGVCHEEGGKGGKLGYRKLERCANDLKFGGGELGVGIRNSSGVGGSYLDREEWEEEKGMDVDKYDDNYSD